jgi:hypothetical protein
VGHGVEIEDDTVRLRRHKLEFDDDAARHSHRGSPRPWKVLSLVSGTSAALARRRSRRPARC